MGDFILDEFTQKALNIAKILRYKNKVYGDSYNKTAEIMKMLFPKGIECEDYTKILILVRILDKVFRIVHGNDNEDSWRDIAGYALLMTKKNNFFT